MKEEDIRKVHDAILKSGDSFWNENDEGDIHEQIVEGKIPLDWNGYLFNEILTMLEANGMDLELVELEHGAVCLDDIDCRYNAGNWCLKRQGPKEEGLFCTLYKPFVDYKERKLERIIRLLEERKATIYVGSHLHRALKMTAKGVQDNQTLRTCEGSAVNLQWGLIYGFFSRKRREGYFITKQGRRVLEKLNEAEKTRKRVVVMKVDVNETWAEYFKHHTW